jgi:glycerophosphoryl diester phosphodiesterase
MPEAESAENCKTLAANLQVTVIAFDASDFQPDTIGCAQKAIDLGAAGIQTDLPAQLVSYLRAHKRQNPF